MTYIRGTNVCDVEIGHGFEDWTSIRGRSESYIYIYKCVLRTVRSLHWWSLPTV